MYEKLELIAHAGGSIDGKIYTNSKEALLKAIADGYKFIEIDLRKSLGGKYFGAHKIREFNEMTGYWWLYFLPPTVRQIRKRKIYGKFTPLLLTDIAEILKDHPDVTLVTDKADDCKAILKDFPYPEQLIVEVGKLSRYRRAKKVGVKYVALNTQDFDMAEKNNVRIVVTSRDVDPSSAINFAEKGNCVMLASFNNSQSVPSEFNRSNFLVYVDER